MRYRTLIAPLTALLLTSCGPSSGPLVVESLEAPSSAPINATRLSGTAQGGLILSWLEPGDDGATLRFSRYGDDGWQAPQTVVEGRDMFVNWADKPSVLPIDANRLSAHWLERSGSPVYAYDVVYVQSADDGQSWSEPMRPHADGTQTEHGFVSMYTAGIRTGLVWLDGRKTATKATDDPVSSSMTLRAATIGPGLDIGDEHVIDEIVCDCCQTDVAIASSGPVAVYRDRTVDDIRDISVTRLVDGKWLPGQTISNDNWQIFGCPVNGPRIVADGDTVVAAWFTAADDSPVVKASWSHDGGATFGEPIEITAKDTRGQVGLVLLDDDTAAISWLQSESDSNYEFKVRTLRSSGKLGDVRTVATGVNAVSVPQMALTGTDLVFAWSVTEGPTIYLASARAAAESL